VGHLHLVETAAAACDRVTVLVLAASWEEIPLALRLDWMRELCDQWPNVTVWGGMDEVPVDYEDAAVWDAHMAVFEAGIREAAPEGPPVDAVFTSEAYGEELARRLGARHVLVDLDRRFRPVSGTAVRENPAAVWDFIPAPVRAYLALRVVIIGSESTGTTTLTKALTAHYRARGPVWAATQWVPEYGREYTHDLLAAARAKDPAATMFDLKWDTPDFVTIARRQNAMEDAAARIGSPVLFCDTDSLATAVWHERYLQTRSAEVEAIAAEVHHDLYLLTDHVGVPFEQDGIRDGEHLRAWMTGRFREVLKAGGYPYVDLTGPYEARWEMAIAAVDWLLAQHLDLRRGVAVRT
jgi:NadR type nicotinamide-nucleotide adenylyltransferase